MSNGPAWSIWTVSKGFSQRADGMNESGALTVNLAIFCGSVSLGPKISFVLWHLVQELMNSIKGIFMLAALNRENIKWLR